MFCTILTNRCCSAIGPVYDADTIVLYDTDLNPSVDAHTQEWCDKIGRSKDIHIYRCCFQHTDDVSIFSFIALYAMLNSATGF